MVTAVAALLVIISIAGERGAEGANCQIKPAYDYETVEFQGTSYRCRRNVEKCVGGCEATHEYFVHKSPDQDTNDPDPNTSPPAKHYCSLDVDCCEPTGTHYETVTLYNCNPTPPQTLTQPNVKFPDGCSCQHCAEGGTESVCETFHADNY